MNTRAPAPPTFLRTRSKCHAGTPSCITPMITNPSTSPFRPYRHLARREVPHRLSRSSLLEARLPHRPSHKHQEPGPLIWQTALATISALIALFSVLTMPPIQSMWTQRHMVGMQRRSIGTERLKPLIGMLRRRNGSSRLCSRNGQTMTSHLGLAWMLDQTRAPIVYR
jgi:hypothetical protein